MVVGGARSTRYSGATLGEFSNPNLTALALFLPLACFPAAWACTKEKWLRLVLLASAPAILAATLMTGSRAALIAALFAALLSLALARGAGVVQRILIPAICVLIIAVTVHFVLQFRLLSERSQARLEMLMESSVHAEEEARTAIRKMTLSTFLTRPWGFGYDNTTAALEQTHSFFIDIHSTYFSALVDGGAISFVLFGNGMWLTWRCLRGIRRGGLSMPAMILFLYVSIAGLTHTIHFSKWFWLPLMFCVLLAEQARRDELNESKPDAGPAPPPLTTADLLRNLGSGDASGLKGQRSSGWLPSAEQRPTIYAAGHEQAGSLVEPCGLRADPQTRLARLSWASRREESVARVADSTEPHWHERRNRETACAAAWDDVERCVGRGGNGLGPGEEGAGAQEARGQAGGQKAR